MTFQLRDYQQSAVTAAENFVKYREGNGYVTAPGGSGKSVMIAKLAERLFHAGFAVVILARNEKLLTQNQSKLDEFYQEKSGIYCAGLGQKHLDKPITIASIQSICNQVIDTEGRELIALVDECDEIHPDKKGDSQYWKFFRGNNMPRIVGFTATPFRTGSGKIQWGDEIINIAIEGLFKDKYIIPPVGKGVEVDLSNVSVTAGEYNWQQLAQVYEDPELLKITIEKLLQYSANRNHVLVFCASVKHCDEIAMILGDDAVVVTGDTPKWELTAILEEFQAGKFKYLINCQLLTIGVDLPCVDMIALLIATKSKRKFEQCLYRGTRLYENKKDFLVLDMGNNFMEHGALGSPFRGKGSGEQEPEEPGRICPSCEEFNAAPLALDCTNCGFLWPEPETRKVNHDYQESSQVNYYRQGEVIQAHEVWDVTYKKRISKSGNPMIVVEYHCDYGKYGTLAEWLLPHHENEFVSGRFVKFLRERDRIIYDDLRNYSMDDLIKICEELKKPSSIIVDHGEKFPKVKEVQFGKIDIDDALDGDEIVF